MGLQEQIAEAIVIAFDELGGDPQSAIEAARQHASVESWLQQETTKVAVAGGAEMLIPGLHALTIPAGISYLIHKMAHISWGIGAIKGAYVVETAQYSDLRNILALWANSPYFNAHIIDYLAISMDTFSYCLTEDGSKTLNAAVTRYEEKANVVSSTLQLLQALVYDFEGNERARRMVETITGKDIPDDLQLSARDDVPDDLFMDRAMTRRISTKLALRLAARISARVPARLLVGFIPVAGAIVNAFFNAQTLQTMADMATKYYDHQLGVDTLKEGE
jgi:hypothetical protein